MRTVVYAPNTGFVMDILDDDLDGKEGLLQFFSGRGYGFVETDDQTVAKNTHIVVAGAIHKITPAEFEENERQWNLIKLRQFRNARLRNEVDALNPIRWELMPENKRQEWRKYRRQLLDLPQNTPDSRNPKWPEKPK